MTDAQDLAAVAQTLEASGEYRVLRRLAFRQHFSTPTELTKVGIGVKVSVATTLKHSKGGQFVAHAQALPGNPYDGHTLAAVIPAIEQLVGNTIERLHADAGYRGHNAPSEYKFKVYTSRQKRRVTPAIKREMKRRAAVEPVIGHTKEEHRMGRNYLAGRHGDANNAVLAAAGYNFRRLIRWLNDFLRIILALLFVQSKSLPV
jgi:transposase, IS5 family